MIRSFIVFISLECIHIYSNPVSSARTLQHPALLQCLAQCSEVTPYLLVMEFCPLVGHTLMLKFCLFSPSHTPHYSLCLCIVIWIIQSEQPHLVSPLRVIWRATCAVVGWLTLRLLTPWSSSEWRVTLPQGFCTSTNTTLYTGTVCQSALPSSILMPRIHLNVLCDLCWPLPATTSWCCLSSCHKLQHQWFCCRGRAPLSQPCGGCHSNLSVAARPTSSLFVEEVRIKQSDLV